MLFCDNTVTASKLNFELEPKHHLLSRSWWIRIRIRYPSWSLIVASATFLSEGWLILSLFYMNWWGPGTTCIHADRAGITPSILTQRRESRGGVSCATSADEAPLLGDSSLERYICDLATRFSRGALIWAGARVNVQGIFPTLFTYNWMYPICCGTPVRACYEALWTAEGQNSSGWSCKDALILKFPLWYHLQVQNVIQRLRPPRPWEGLGSCLFMKD